LGAFALLVPLAFIVIEKLRPIRPSRTLRKGFGADFLHLLFNGGIAKLMLITPVIAMFVLLKPFAGDGLIHEWPRWAQGITALLVIDLTGYWTHRVFHGRLLWRFHRIHHSSEHLDWFASFRRHPLNEVINKSWAIIPLILLGTPKGILGGAMGLVGIWGLLLHANIDLRLRWLRFLVATPQFHHWHHADLVALPREHDREGVNFGGLLPFWDLLFGTYYCPDRWPASYGADRAVPDGWLGQMLDPLRPEPERIVRWRAGSVPHVEPLAG
jgi:sterol desaturase/sphingolipid hydroxylase (fatty acid hydroxylase superfamily)